MEKGHGRARKTANRKASAVIDFSPPESNDRRLVALPAGGISISTPGSSSSSRRESSASASAAAPPGPSARRRAPRGGGGGAPPGRRGGRPPRSLRPRASDDPCRRGTRRR